MNVLKHIEDALERGNSPFTVMDVLMAFIAGNLVILKGTSMSGSYWVRDKTVEVVHVGGKFNREDMKMMFEHMKQSAAQLGLPYRWSGRKGWVRKMRMEGLI